MSTVSITDSKKSHKNYLAALAFAQKLNLPVFPLCPRTKKPIHDGGFKNATTDIEQIKEWWNATPDANIGMPCGAVSGIVVLDEDPRNGGSESLHRLEDDYEKLPDTVTCLTPGGGQHFWFKWDDRISKSKLYEYEGLDVQGNGKYVVLPPSVHPNGKEYTFELSSRPLEVPIAEMPGYLIQMLKDEPSQRKKKPTSYWANVMNGSKEGERNHTASQLAGHLFRRYVDPHIVLEVLHMWNQFKNESPLSKEELNKVINSIAGKELRRRNGGRA
ncbi:bifunctional DNA primase/polymerase [Pseudalkalibacillus decolorationis]|uniref:bifunctional DNA primase/polymerase n=1 Tax=Pseudalkalibacillus decolorationis TaxID=163879 RepID=UPI0021474AD1|nr:bifunctional DNA primase/polymerase [Pseudalkalibacillus decolorationis]